jgi:MoxR-like ATPase
MFCVNVDYPTAEEESQILLSTTKDFAWTVERIIHGEMIEQFQHLVRQVPVSEHVAKFATTLVRSTRPNENESPDFIKKWLRWGAGPRAGQYLLLAAKANALLSGKFNVSCDDVRDFALPVLRHRIFCNFSASSEGVGVDDVIKRLVDFVKEPDYK